MMEHHMLKKGTKFKVIGNSDSHGFDIGQEVYYVKTIGHLNYYSADRNMERPRYIVSDNDLEFVKRNPAALQIPHLEERAEYYSGLQAGKVMEWRFSDKSGIVSMWIKGHEPSWYKNKFYEVREAPKTVNLPEREIPEPVKEITGTCWLASPLTESLCIPVGEFSSGLVTNGLERGLVFDTKEKAIEAAKAMLPNGVDCEQSE